MLDLNGSGAPKMPADGYVWICRASTTSHRGRVRPGTSLLGLFGDGRQGYSAPESTPAGPLSGECRLNAVLQPRNGCAFPAQPQRLTS